MKHIIIISLGLLLITSKAQSQQNSAGEQVAQKIALRMKDSLQLSQEQQNQLYSINLQLHISKTNVRQQYASTDSLGVYIQRIENTRDSLYQIVLPGDKYILYKQKKAVLIKNN